MSKKSVSQTHNNSARLLIPLYFVMKHVYHRYVCMYSSVFSVITPLYLLHNHRHVAVSDLPQGPTCIILKVSKLQSAMVTLLEKSHNVKLKS